MSEGCERVCLASVGVTEAGYVAGMPFGKNSTLPGPIWTAACRADLTAAQHTRLEVVSAMSAELYNALLEAWRGQHRWHTARHRHDGLRVEDVYDKTCIAGDRGTLYGQFALLRQTETHRAAGGEAVLWSGLASQIGRGVIDRFDDARRRFYQRCKLRNQGARVKVGYPRFKPGRSWSTITIPDPKPSMVKPPDEQSGRWRLCVKGLGTIRFNPYNEQRLSEELAAGDNISEIRVVRKPHRVEVHLVIRTTTADPKPAERPVNPIGIDMGVTSRVATSRGATWPGVRTDRSQIAARQRVLSRHDHRHKTAGTDRHTPGRRRKVQALAAAHARLAERERHSIHRLVHQIVSMCLRDGVDALAVEALLINNMVCNRRLADSIMQQRWGMFLRLLEHKAARAGLAFVAVDPRNTSLDCSRCGHRKPKADLPLSVRVYVCDSCGLRVDRDVNAAINVLVRAFGDETRDGGASRRCGRHTTTTCGAATTRDRVVAQKATANRMPTPLLGCPQTALARA